LRVWETIHRALEAEGRCLMVTVDRWKDGCYQGSYTDVTEIRIMYTVPGSAANHLGYPHKPMNGK